ncbi:hypothetical protein PsYK624_122910 [Phanerochaete sordida]|uniref:Extracellular membrane protein CFEM domain-containing protein n=1 Tax=Phanerochaete sordida TaxID=48140 RepID=A0A9P3GJJ1_9APHY|nr:hypothetical protein PsYK624_122910 [Phanerochaete sordida]
MVAAKFALLSLVLVASEVAASAIVSRHGAFRTLLKARQGGTISPGDIAPECQSACATFVQVNNDCETDETKCLEVCTNTNMGSVASCLSCAISVDGPPDADTAAQAQEALEQLEEGCSEAGDPVQSFTVSGATSVPTSAVGSGGDSLSLPLASSSSQAVFFSSSGAAAPTGAKSTAGAASNTNTAPGPSNTAGSSQSGAASNPTPTLGLGNGAARVAGGASAAAAFGVALMFALVL